MTSINSGIKPEISDSPVCLITWKSCLWAECSNSINPNAEMNKISTNSNTLSNSHSWAEAMSLVFKMLFLEDNELVDSLPLSVTPKKATFFKYKLWYYEIILESAGPATWRRIDYRSQRTSCYETCADWKKTQRSHQKYHRRSTCTRYPV